jgi:hypothetical protein
VCGDWKLFAASVEDVAGARPAHFVTNVIQFRSLTGADYLVGCDFRLTGVVTLVDTNRDLVVLQDATGAVALNFRLKDYSLQVGQLVTLEGENCCPYFPGFPDYPYRPSEWNIQTSFESPMDLNEYRLTRMRGCLHPGVTGEYSFWIASDNSSELWLSVNADPSKARKIASITRFGYVLPREWSHYPSQHSEPILLKAGETYYIEALSEQTTGGEYLGVAWQGPGLNQSVIESPYLTPWRAMEDTTNGILRECWTNFSAGDLDGLAGPRGFESALTVEKVRMSSSGPGELPKPDRLALNQRLLAEDNYRWVQAEGVVKFTGADGGVAFFELSDGQALVQVRALHWSSEMSRRIGKAPIRVEGVCEGVFDQKKLLTPGLIWATAESSITFLESAATNVGASTVEQPAQSMASNYPAMQGFYGTRGVVTFNDQVFGNDYTFVQEDSAAVLVALTNHSFRNRLKVGQWVELGGALIRLKKLTPSWAWENRLSSDSCGATSRFQAL